MNLLKVLALLGRGDQAASEGMYEVLVDVMKRADTGINIGYAIGAPLTQLFCTTVTTTATTAIIMMLCVATFDCYCFHYHPLCYRNC